MRSRLAVCARVPNTTTLVVAIDSQLSLVGFSDVGALLMLEALEYTFESSLAHTFPENLGNPLT